MFSTDEANSVNFLHDQNWITTKSLARLVEFLLCDHYRSYKLEILRKHRHLGLDFVHDSYVYKLLQNDLLDNSVINKKTNRFPNASQIRNKNSTNLQTIISTYKTSTSMNVQNRKLLKVLLLLLKVFLAYNVLDAKFVSSCFSCPSRASPRWNLLFFNNGRTLKTLLRVKPGATGFSLWFQCLEIKSKCKNYEQWQFRCEFLFFLTSFFRWGFHAHFW